MRLIIDTNVLGSAFIFKSAAANNVVRHTAKEHTLIFSESTFKELKSTLLKLKFAEVTELPTIRNLLINLVRIDEFVEPNIKVSDCRDPQDNKFLELAVTGNADCIITGDKDLLVLDPFRNIRIISPKEFLSQY